MPMLTLPADSTETKDACSVPHLFFLSGYNLLYPQQILPIP
jgi:hypothetical protein